MISTHILDLQSGLPASSVEVTLLKQVDNKWSQLQKSSTNNDGRIAFELESEAGIYRLNFHIESYLRKRNVKPFFLDTEVTFEITDLSRKYHVPLLLSPFGYSTYRGS